MWFDVKYMYMWVDVKYMYMFTHSHSPAENMI